MYNVSIFLNNGEKVTLKGINFVIKRNARTYFEDEEGCVDNFLSGDIRLIIMEVM